MRNDLYGADGGNIGVGIYPGPDTSRNSPYSFDVYEGKRLNLAAYDNQNVNGKVWFFNNTEYQIERSVWRKTKPGVINELLSQEQTFTTGQLAATDDDITITAFLKSTNYTTSGTMSSNEIWFTPVTLAGNVTIASGVTLKIASGTTVTLNGNYIKCSGTGKIENAGDITGYLTYAQEGSYYKGYFPSSTSLQQVIDWASSGWDIHTRAGSFGNITMKTGVDVDGSGISTSDLYTVTFPSGVSNCVLSDFYVAYLTMYNSGWSGKVKDIKSNYRICVTNGSPWLEDVQVDQGDYNHGIDVSNGSPSLVDITSTTSRTSSSHGAAIYLHNYSGASIDVQSIRNKYRGIRIGNSSFSSVYAGFCQNTWDLYAESSAYDSDVYSTPFSALEPEDCIYPPDDIESYFNIEDWGYCGSLAKENAAVETFHKFTFVPANDEFSEGYQIYHSLRRQLVADSRETGNVEPKKFENDFNRAIDKLKSFAKNHEPGPKTLKALKVIETCYYFLEQPENFTAYLDAFVQDSRHESLKPYLLNLVISNHIQCRKPESALKTADEIIATCSDKDLIPEVIYQKGLIYKYDLGESKTAEAIFKQLIEKWPEHPTALSAEGELASMGEPKSQLAGQSEAAAEFTTQNYPNPFNPETRIHFTLPEAGKITIKIYDIQGREVITLLDDDREAGTHTLQWNGLDNSGLKVASGMYFYHINYNGKILTNKMLMVR